MTAYDDGSNSYGLIRFNLQAAIKNAGNKISVPVAESSKNSTHKSVKERAPTSSSEKAALKGAEPSDSFFVDKNSAYITTDLFGFISQVSTAA